ncbi:MULTISPECIES: AraC family transcriptional regulator [unclassified Oceanispirochaeta]|uniref:AraC family transcriptional regulator n=1 Tax=unclassified Oceanispirochaeta TaxID=2635722 RepID=UPI000E0913C1|nr:MULTISPECIES: AraC family transcriptional regulator [unclassified Oceanispirochaeta]MBF9016817.1 helix-turn-helix transcriptional regulator [Oceanispirochaeta sp. M2]NPD72087.1 helix-turn-helix transcriptional regulator [Oceanispirochaeta sp. M1]RDG32530.1 AraC family transcriptional regulator [Oceanispirochaeta sp. M1]
MVLDYGIVHCPADWHVDESIAPGYSRLYYVKGGDALYHDQGQTLPLLERHFYVLPTAIPYKLSHDPENPFICVYLHMDFFPGNLSSIYDISASEDPVLFNLLETLSECIGKESQKLIAVLADALVLYCIEEALFTITEGMLTPLLHYITENLDRDLSVEDLSNRAGYNSQYFIRLFREELGTTPYQYIIARRMERARTLLKTGITITEVSDKTGFADVKSFSRAFRKYNSLSPSAYRENPVSGP